MKISTRIAFAALTLVAAGLAACASDHTAATTTNAPTEAKTTAPVNKTCPFSGKEAKATITSTCDGKTVSFCCPGCKGKFDKMDHAKQEAMVGKAQ